MDFRLTYAGELLAHKDNHRRLRERSLHVHTIRREFHKQLKVLWANHPSLLEVARHPVELPNLGLTVNMRTIFEHDGFKWLPLVTKTNGLICKVDILLLRPGPQGKALSDIDNRLKTISDALRKAKGPDELGARTKQGQQQPSSDEDPFFVVLEDDSLITHVAVTADTLLEPVPDVPTNESVRLVIDVTIRPYETTIDNLSYS